MKKLINDQPIKFDIKRYEEIKLTTVQGEDYMFIRMFVRL